MDSSDTVAVAQQLSTRGHKAGTYKTFEGLQERFRSAQARDVIWAVLFWLHFAGFAGYVGYRASAILANKMEGMQLEYDVVTGYFPVLFIASGFAMLFACVWTLLLKNFPRLVVYTAALVPPALLLAGCIMAALGGAVPQAAMLGFGLACNLVYLWCIWEKLDFTAMLLQVTTCVMQKFYGMIVVTLMSLVPGVIVIFLYLLAFAIIKHDVEDNTGSRAEGKGLAVLTAFSFYWTWAVLGNVVHTTICGAMGRWYFLAEEQSVTAPALRQSMTSSFGPIALGSGIMALVKTLKLLINIARQNAEDSDNPVGLLVACILSCIVSCIESMLEFISTYAFVYVAFYGASFCEGASESFKLLRETGLDMVVTYDLSSSVSFLGSLVGAGCTGLATKAVLLLHGPWLLPGGHSGNDSGLQAAYIGFGVLVGMAAVLVVSSVVESGACSLLVAFAEEPGVLRERHPELDAKIEQLQGNRQPNGTDEEAQQARPVGP